MREVYKSGVISWLSLDHRHLALSRSVRVHESDFDAIITEVTR